MRTSWDDIIADLFHRLEDVERRVHGGRRTGTIHEVDAAKGLARVKLGEDPETGDPYLSRWAPWKMPAMGDVKVNIPPTVGQQVEVVSETGDMTDLVIDSSLRSNANPLPAAQPGEGVITRGDTTIFFDDGNVRITTGTVTITAGLVDITADMHVTGKITHVGDNEQVGVHTDDNGIHS